MRKSAKTIASLLATVILSANGTVTHRTIGGNDYTFTKEHYEVYDSKGTVVRCYYEARNRDLLHRFTLTLEDRTGTCGARSIEEGAYEIKGDIVTLYTLWHREGRSYDTPYGVRIMRYRAERNGTFTLLLSRIYVEETAKGFDLDSGMRFLWKRPQSESEKKAFAAYIDRMQMRFKGTFVLGEEAKALIAEVEAALERKARKRWR